MTICILIATAALPSLVNLVVNWDINIPNRGIFFPPPSSILKQTSAYGIIYGEATSQSTAASDTGGDLATVFKISGLSW
jgi:hypothetical protein